MSYKKLRLDPELPSPQRNQSGASDNGGRTFLDGSSFSSSTSGGSGAYGKASSGPFRTRYSQPMGVASPSASSFSRFSPYYFGRERRTTPRVPLIRARRDDSDSDGCRPSSRASLNSSIGGDSTALGTSSTAQRIIETLQNLSTPVMNAGKIRIDQDIKAVQPLSFGGGTSFSRMSPGGSLNRSTGPPKMCSSLLLSNPSPANQTSPMFNAGDQRRIFSIPKMVDVATNTEKEDAPPPSQIQSNKTTTSVAPPPVTNTSNLKSVSSKDDNSEEEFHECSSEFTFSSPWGPDVFDRYLAGGKDEKSSSKGNFGLQQPLLNGFKEIPTTFGTPEMSSKGISSISSFVGGSPSFPSNAAKSPNVPLVSSSSSFSGSSNTGSFGLALTKDTSEKTPSILFSEIKTDNLKSTWSENISSTRSSKKRSASPLDEFSYERTGASPPKSSDSSKSISFGCSPNKDFKLSVTSSFDKVDGSKTTSPITTNTTFSNSGSQATFNLPPLNTLKSTSAPKWRCGTCMVDNDVKATTCVCCGEKNTNSQASVAPKHTTANTSGNQNKKWRCRECMVENELDAPNCVCCNEKNPNPIPTSVAQSSVEASTSKKWRCPECFVDNDIASANCVCCSTSNPNSIGEKKVSLTAAGTAPPASFTFAAPKSVPTTSSSFVFGASAQSDIQKSPAVGFKFGLPPATASAAPAPVSSTTLVSSSQSTSTSVVPTFKFGATVTSASNSFSFETPVSTLQQQSTSTVNTSTTSTVSMFSTSKAPESNTSGIGGVFGSSGFQPSQSAPSNSFKFGSSTPATTMDAQKSNTVPTFNFGASPSSKPAFSTFTFGDRQQNPPSGPTGATSSLVTPAVPTPAPTLSSTSSSFSFGSNNPTASPFGQTNPSNPAQPAPGGLFQFGRGVSFNPQPPSVTPAPTPTFSLTPNINFAATPGSAIPFGNPTQPTPNAASQPPPALFQFNSTSNDSPSGRKIKKAVRRFKN